MVSRLRRARHVFAAVVLSLFVASPVLAQEVFEVPVDPREKLNELDDAVLAKQRALFAARQRGDQEAVKKLKQEFEEIQRQRSTVIRDARHLF